MAAITFKKDNQSLKFARNAGVFIEGIDWEVDAARKRFSRREIMAYDPVVILCFGQSNAANHGIGRPYTPRHPVYCFNLFDCQFYSAEDPLPGASGSDGGPWGRLGDLLIEGGHAKSVVLIDIAFGGTFAADWAPGGEPARRLVLAILRAKRAGLRIDWMLWWQGEAEANNTQMRRAQYKKHFLAMVAEIRANGVLAPIWVARSTLCATEGRPFDNRQEIRSAQLALVDPGRGILAGPDTDDIGLDGRHDGCHFNDIGLQRAAELWLQTLRSAPVTELSQTSRKDDGQGAALVAVGRLIKRILRGSLDRFGYVVMKKETYDRIRSGEDRPIASQSTEEAAATRVAAELRKLGVPEDFVRDVARGSAKVQIPADQAAVLFTTVQRVLSDGIPGSIVDCGNGSAGRLAFIGTTLSFLGQRSRPLVLLDVSRNPLEQAETALQPWGKNVDFFAGSGQARCRVEGIVQLPHELENCGYPVEKITVIRSVLVRNIPREIALLLLTSEAYPANCAAVKAILPTVAENGAIIVTDSTSAISTRDAINEALEKLEINLPFRQVSKLRVATMGRPQIDRSKEAADT